MPVPTRKFLIKIHYREEANRSPGHKLLYKIMQHVTFGGNEHNENHFMLICKAIFYSYDSQRNELSEKILREFFNRNGYPISLSPETLMMNHKQWDGIERLIIVCQGATDRGKVVAFERSEGGRRIRFGYLR